MYLATLDDSFSEETINILYEANVVVVTTIENKNFKYKNNNRVCVSFYASGIGVFKSQTGTCLLIDRGRHEIYGYLETMKPT